MIEELAQQLYAETMAQNADVLASYSAEQQEAARTGTLKRCREYVANLSNAIDAKDVDGLLKAVHRHNANSRKVFKVLTGIDPGKTDKACREAIRQYVGAEFFAQHENETTAKAAERQADWRRKQEEKEREAELGQRTVIRFPGEQVQTLTIREMIDGLLARGFRPKESKRGFAKTLKMVRPGESLTLKRKHEIAYALEKAAALVEAE